jgi:recombination protein RecT
MTTPNAPAVTQKTKTLGEYLSDQRVIDGIKAVAGNYLRPERMLKLVTSSISKVPRLAQCDPKSFLGAVMTSAALELEPNTPQGHAYLIPYDKRGKDPQTGKWGVIGTECQFIIGYRGFIELAYRNPKIKKFVAKPIYKNDLFECEEGSTAFLRHRQAMEDRGPLIGAFAFAQYETPSGAIADMSMVLPLEEIHKARSKSETYNFLAAQVEKAEAGYKREQAEKKLAETPWVMWEGDMAAKTAIRRLAKFLPVGGSFASAAALDENAEAGIVDFGAMADASTAKGVAEGDEAPVIGVEYEDEPQAPALPQPTERPLNVVTGGKGQPQPETVSAGPQPTQRDRRGKAPAQEEPPPYDPETGEILAPGQSDDGGLNFGG